MIEIAAVVAAVALAGAVAAGLVVLFQRASWRFVERRRVVVAIETGQGPRTLSGILWERRGPLLVLHDAAAFLGADELATPMDGVVVVERARVMWVQVIR